MAIKNPEAAQAFAELVEHAKHVGPVLSVVQQAEILVDIAEAFRVAFLVVDARAAHAELQRLGVDCPPPAFLDLGPEVPIDGVWAVFFRDPDGACLELIEIPS